MKIYTRYQNDKNVQELQKYLDKLNVFNFINDSYNFKNMGDKLLIDVTKEFKEIFKKGFEYYDLFFNILFVLKNNKPTLVLVETFINEISEIEINQDFINNENQIIFSENGINRLGVFIPMTTEGFLDSKIILLTLSNLYC